MRNKIFSRQVLCSDYAVLTYVALLYLLTHVVATLAGGYGYFIDEFYYIACAKRLALGYVDHPPLAPWLLRIVLVTFGDSLMAIRFLPALAGAITVFMTGLLARQLGAGKFGQLSAAGALAIAPGFLVISGFFSMNPFEMLLWTACVYVLLLLINQDRARLWLVIGALIGLGLLNKHTLIVYVAGLIVGLLLTPARKYLATRWIWFGAMLAGLILLPNIFWQIRYGFPSLEFYRNATLFKNVPTSPIKIVFDQILVLNPVTFPIWIIGLYFYLFSRSGKPYRLFGWIYVIPLVAMLAARSSRPDRILAAYPMLFAGGAFLIEHWIKSHRQRGILQKSVIAVLMIGGIGFLPMGVPILPPALLAQYSQKLGLSVQIEKDNVSQLPQWFADRFGWPELVKTVADVYQRLSPEEQAKCTIFARSYGEAGAIDFFGPKYNLPGAVSSHNNYWLWGPGEKTGEVVILLGGDLAEHQQSFQEVTQAALFTCQYCKPFENNLPIYVARWLQIPLRDIWLQVKHYD